MNDSEYYSSHPVFSTSDALQIFGYYDELTLTNPLMSNYKDGLQTHPMSFFHDTGTIYFMLGNLDPSLRSRLENVHLVALFRSQLLETYSFNEILAPFSGMLRHTVIF